MLLVKGNLFTFCYSATLASGRVGSLLNNRDGEISEMIQKKCGLIPPPHLAIIIYRGLVQKMK